MADTWYSEDPYPELKKMSPLNWVLFVIRGLIFAALCLGGAVLVLLCRLVEKPLCGELRPFTSYIHQAVGRSFFPLVGMRRKVTGRPMTHPGIFVSNHVAWLDILVLMSAQRAFFVSKADVAGWPVIGWLTRVVGTVFISRDRRDARAQTEMFRRRLLDGQQMLFFPEGTSTDGHRVLPFKSTLFASFMDPELRDKIYVQPISVLYHGPSGEDPRYYGWWGDMDFGPHFMKVLGSTRQGMVEIIFHEPLKVSDFDDRKALALASEEAVRGGFPWDWQLKA